MRLFYKHDTTDYRLLWGKTQSDYKDHKLKAVTRNNLYCKGISSERKFVQIIKAFSKISSTDSVHM